MTPAEREALVERLHELDEGLLDEKELEELAGLLAADAEARRELVSYGLFTVDLASAVEATYDARRIRRLQRRRKGRLLSYAGAAAALVVLAFQLPSARNRDAAPGMTAREDVGESAAERRPAVLGGPVAAELERTGEAVVESWSGEVTVSDADSPLALVRETAVLRGALIRTELGATVTLRYPSGVRVTIGARSVASLPERGGSLVHLDRGAVSVDVPAGVAQPLALGSALGQVTAGAGSGPKLLDVRAGPQFLRVDVEAGEATIVRARDGQAALVERGRHALVLERGQVRARPADAPVLIVVGTHLPASGDREIEDRLEELGFTIEVVGDRQVTREQLQRASAVYLSSSTRADHVRPRGLLKSLEAPIICAERSLLDDIGMVAPRREAVVVRGQSHVDMRSPHPLWAGLNGRIMVSRAPTKLSAVEGPLPGALEIASVAGRATQLTVFAYDRAAPSPMGAAPARRLALLVESQTPQTLTEEGWALFDAAVLWALERNSSPDAE